jgi:hypothetical protein
MKTAQPSSQTCKPCVYAVFVTVVSLPRRGQMMRQHTQNVNTAIIIHASITMRIMNPTPFRNDPAATVCVNIVRSSNNEVYKCFNGDIIIVGDLYL